MEEGKFDEPRLAINRVYTRRGDSGETALVGGRRVPKDSVRIEAYGTVDELNAFVGMACQTARDALSLHPQLHPLITILDLIQHELFNLGSILATRQEDVHPRQPRVTSADVSRLENEIDVMNEGLVELRSFVLPGGSRLNVELHVCRTICRRAERICVRLAREEQIPVENVHYLNRLGDAFFVWSRWASHIMNTSENLWDPNRKSGVE